MDESTMVSGLAKAALEKYADPFFKGITNYVKDEWEKFKIDFDLSFTHYLENASEKYGRIKTILYKTEPKYLYDFFECPYIRKGRLRPVKGNNINYILDDAHYAVIQGTGGIGKSTFLKHLFLNELSQKDLIPVFIELKDLNFLPNDPELIDIIFDRIEDLEGSLKRDYIEYALKSGCFLFLFDGFDEIISSKKDLFLKKLDSFCDKYSQNYFILSSRPYTEFVELQRFTVFEVCCLTKSQAVSLIRKLDYDREIQEQFAVALENKLYERHKSFASNPLLLNIMLLTYDSYAEIPEKLHLFYSNAFDTLYSKHDATKAGYRRELETKLDKEIFKNIFATFCFKGYYEGQFEFTNDEITSMFGAIKKLYPSLDIDGYLHDLENSICVLYRDGLTYKFTHRSFQEYFSAIFLKELPDDKMNEIGCRLVRHAPDRVAHDNVFPMLKDMAEQRYEQNILLPLLLKVEEACPPNEDKYDFYLKARNPKMLFAKPEGDELVLGWFAGYDDTTIFAVFELCSSYRKKARSDDQDKAAQSLFTRLSSQKKISYEDEFEAMDIINDPIAYNLFRKTWIGNTITCVATLAETIQRKHSEKALDFSELFG